MTITRNMRLSALLLFALALPLFGQDVLTIDSATALSSATTVGLPGSIRDLSGTRLGSDGTRIQGIAIKVDITPASAVTSASFVRAGVAASLTPLFERNVSTTGGGTLLASYIVSFDETSQALPLALNAAAPGTRVATLNVTLASPLNAGTRIAIAIDRDRTLLANESGSMTESAYNRHLATVDAEIEIDGYNTTTVLGTSPNPSVQGNAVTMSAQVTSPVAGTIAGNVAFYAGVQLLGRVALSGGQAVLVNSTLPAGTHSLTAKFEGNPSYRISTSNVVSQVVNTPPFGAPTNVVATPVSSSSVRITWAPVSNAYTYEIRRSLNGVTYSTRSYVYSYQNTTTYFDTVDPNVTYFYVVRAYANGGGASADSVRDYATTTAFTNDPLASGSTPIRLAHLTQLRQAVNAFRAAAGLPAATFTDPSPTTQTRVKAVHVMELRTAFNQARAALSYAPIDFVDPNLSAAMPVRAIHFQQLRDVLK